MKTLKIPAIITGVILAFTFAWYLFSRINTIYAPLSVYSIDHQIDKRTATQNGSLKVASYNIAHGRGGELGAKNRSHQTKQALLEHLDKISAQIRNENPDIIVLNETDFSSAWSFNVNQAAYIAVKCGYPYLLEQKNMGVSFPFYHLYFGNAILSRFPIRNESFIDFHPYSRLEDLVAGNHDAVLCEVKLPSGPVAILGVHFEYRSETIRLRCAEMLTEITSTINHPVIVLGDFNSTPQGLAKSKKSESGKNAMSFLFNEKGFVSFLRGEKAKNIYTFPSGKPDRLIDWIIGRGIKAFSNSKVIHSDLSDHLMIVTEVQI